jgi:hypothetical protein
MITALEKIHTDLENRSISVSGSLPAIWRSDTKALILVFLTCCQESNNDIKGISKNGSVVLIGLIIV